jgi:hypothetical protein
MDAAVDTPGDAPKREMMGNFSKNHGKPMIF